MNFKTTYILFAVLVAMLVLFLVAQRSGKRPGEEETAYVLPTLAKADTKDINGVEIDINGSKSGKIIFARRDNNWVLLHPDARADASQVNLLVSELNRASKDERADMTGGPALYGLDHPVAVVTIRAGSEKEWKLNIGKASAGKEDAVIYVTSSERPNEPMAVRRSSIDALIKDVDDKGNVEFKTAADYRSKTLLADNGMDITWLKLQEEKKEPLVLDKTGENHWHFEKPAYGDADYEGEPAPPGGPATPHKITGVRDLLQAVADIRVESNEDFGAADASGTELADKGLEKGKEKLRIEAKIQPAFGGEDKKQPVQDALLIGKKADDKGDKFYARLESDKNIVKVPAAKVDAVLKVFGNPAILRNHDLTQIDTAKVDAIDVQPANANAFKLRKTGDPAVWKIYDSSKVHEADSATVQALLTALTVKRLVKEFPEASRTDAELGLDHPSVVLALWSEGVKKEEAKKDEEKKEEKDKEAKKDEKKDDKGKEAKKDDKKDAKTEAAKKEEKKDTYAEPKLKDEKPTVRFSFGKKEKDLVYVKREAGGEVARVAVPASVLDKVSEGKVAYFDRKLPTFGSVADVNKVVFNRGTTTYEIDKTAKDDKTPATWKIKQPKEFTGRTADLGKVDRLLSDLHDLQLERFVTDSPTPADLDRFGLGTPATRAVLTVVKPDKKTEEMTYLFGKETDDKSGVYAKQSGRDLVFVVRRNVVTDMQGDLQDPTVFTFELSKVKGTKMTGWGEFSGVPFTLELERKGPQNYTAKAPADFKVDGAKVENFVSGLTHLRAERFLGPKGAGNPEYKVDLKEGGLDVVITVDGEKEPYHLTIGGPSGADGYYATTNKLPNEVFVLPKGILADVKSRPAYFK
jgi:hypothetical protein